MSRKQGIIYYMNHSPVPYLLCADVTWFLAHSCGGKLPTVKILVHVQQVSCYHPFHVPAMCCCAFGQ